MYIGFAIVLVRNAKAASWNGPTMLPLVIQPKSPCKYINHASSCYTVQSVLGFSSLRK